MSVAVYDIPHLQFQNWGCALVNRESVCKKGGGRSLYLYQRCRKITFFQYKLERFPLGLVAITICRSNNGPYGGRDVNSKKHDLFLYC